MRRILLLAIFCIPFLALKSQNLSYTCPKDVVLGCNSACFSITAQFPDIRAIGNDYTYKNVSAESACRPYIDPGVPGPSAQLTVDDYYSDVLNIGFSFPFYGVPYTQLVASTNGYLSFDLSNALGGAAWTLAGNVPSNGYDASLIMGPWHDIDPDPILVPTSPTEQIKYEVIGSAPTRKWVLSFYKVPLFTNAGGSCNDSILNTHQIVLHESTGIIEVFLIDKQICSGWNSGKAMVGLQDQTRTKGIVPPGRGAADPPWGYVGMNEVWRFIPKGGAPLYRSVELLDGTGTVVATGDTTRVDVNTFSTSFPNVCPPPGASVYVVKTTYQKIDDPTSTIYSLDTINVIRQPELPVTATMTPTTCGNCTGTITVTATGTPAYQYSIDGGGLQASNIFSNVCAGNHTIYAEDATGCNNTITIEVTSISNLPSNVTPTYVSCAGVNDASITVVPTAGSGTYTFTLNPGNITNNTGIFTGLAPDIYVVTFVDGNLCSGTTSSITIPVGTSLTETHSTSNTSCAGATDGSVTVVPDNAGSYNYTLSPGPVSNTTGVFTGLGPGTYSVTFSSVANGCSGTVNNLTVSVGGSITATWSHTQNETCPGAADGVIQVVPNPASPGVYSFTMTPAPSGGATNSTGIFTGCAAGVFYNVNFTNTTTGCTGALTFLFVLAATPVSGTQTHTDANCPGVSDGSITITAAPTGAYTYTIAPPPATGPATNTTGIFNNLSGGTTYSVTFQNAGGCGSSVNNIAILQGAGLTGSAAPQATSCSTANDGSVTITPTNAGTYTYTITPAPVSGPATNTTGIFNNLAAGSYSVAMSNVAGCTGTVNNITINPGAGLTAAAPTTTATSCLGANDGSLTVTPTIAGTYTYTITPAPVSGPATNTTGTFNNLAAGSYSVTFTNAAACSGTVNNIAVSPGPGLTAAPPVPTATSCFGANDGGLTVTPTVSGTYTFTITPAPVSGPATNSTGIFTNLAAGSYSVTFTNTAGCSGTVNNIAVNAGAAITGSVSSSATTCLGANDGGTTVTPLIPGTYTFTINPAPVTGPATNTTGAFSNLAAGAYTVTFLNGLGCGGSSNVTINPGAQLTATSSPNPATSCNGSNDGSVTITPAIADAYTYTISPAPVSGPATNTTGVFSNLAAGVYTVTFTNALGCSGTVANININPGPAITASTLPNGTSCPGVDNGSITITPTIAGTYSFTITPAPVTGPATNTTGVFNNLAAGSYSIQFSNALGCSNTINNIVVLGGTAPTGNASTTITSCPTVNDGTITLTPVPAGTGGPYDFTITGPSGTFTQSGALSTTFTNLAPGIYTATFISNSSGCAGTITPSPEITAGAYLTSTTIPVNPPCANINDGSIAVTPTGSAVAPFTVTLTGPGGPYTVTGNSPVFSNLAPGTYNYSFTDANGCTGTGGPITLTTHTPLAINVAMTQPLCYGNSNGVITLTGSGGLPAYEYAISPFTLFQPGGTFTGLPQGTYTFRLRDAAGCTKDTTVTLNQPTQLTATAAATAGTCNGNDGQILVTGNNGTPVYTYSIDGINYQSANSFIVSGAPGAGAPFGNITVQDNNGCLAVAPLVYVTLVDNMGTLYIGNDTTICAEQPVIFHPQVNPSATVFTWTTIPDPSLISTVDNPAIVSPTATPLDTVTYVLNAQWGVCSRIDTITINVKLKPVPDAGRDTAVCFDKTTALLQGSVSNVSGAVHYEWSDTTNLATPHQSATIALPQATEVFTLTVTDEYGCNFSVQDMVVVVVQPPVPAFAGNDTIAVIGEPHQLNATGGVSYVWTPTAPLNFSTIQNPLATLDHDQLFEVTVTDAAGCVGSDRVFVQVYPGPGYQIPNAFTPNGDGLNDIFRVIPVGIAYTDWFRVFNRYGQLVFETNQWLKGWDGTYQGKKQPMGNYVWVLKGKDKNGRNIELKGTVLLVQ